ncbi:MAG TPA: hypothetical protein VNW99_08545 [Cytophagaceae bacterium]|jgi:hypothetical protein|nr:hypothetical protein [Cytophagaceae bacterium]
MGIAKSQVFLSGEVPRRLVFTISGDGSTLVFAIEHNLNNPDILVQAREISDGLREVFLDNYPDPANPPNKLIVSFDFAPTALQSYKIIVLG